MDHLPRHFCRYSEREYIYRWEGFIQLIPSREKHWYKDVSLAMEWDDFTGGPFIV